MPDGTTKFDLACLPYSCRSPLNFSPTGGLRLPAGKHKIILTYYRTIVNRKRPTKAFFWPCLSVINQKNDDVLWFFSTGPLSKQSILSQKRGSTKKFQIFSLSTGFTVDKLRVMQ